MLEHQDVIERNMGKLIALLVFIGGTLLVRATFMNDSSTMVAFGIIILAVGIGLLVKELRGL